MSTRSHIGILNLDGSVEYVYCHHDGYPEGVGEILKKHYTSEEKLRTLLSLGDVKDLDERIEPINPSEHKDGNREPGTTLFFMRDCGGEYLPSYHCQNLVRYAAEEIYNSYIIEFSYFLDLKSGQWLIFDNHNKPEVYAQYKAHTHISMYEYFKAFVDAGKVSWDDILQELYERADDITLICAAEALDIL